MTTENLVTRSSRSSTTCAARLLALALAGLWGPACGDDGDTTDPGTTTTIAGTTTASTTGDVPTTSSDETTSTTASSDDVTTTSNDTTTTTTSDDTTTTSDDTTSSETTPPDLCGNGVLDGGEVCDDGTNDGAYGGCEAGCGALGPFCGDALQNGPEGCDDGNAVDDDDCSNACVAASCGDAVVQAPESCDDGNPDNTDACLATCVPASCGDTFVQTDVEACDDGNPDNTDACLATCVSATCGDTFVQTDVELCDDGVNDGGYDGCAADCLTLGPRCGDSIVNGPEQCDDGNAIDDDACSNACKGAFAGVFTPCGATGHLGPSQAMCTAAYANSAVVVTVNAGIQTWTAPFTGTYRIEAWGAEGGLHNFGTGGRGAHVRGDIALTQGDTLKLLVGQKGKDGTAYDVGAGGGTFVARTDNTPLLVAGGGGAAGNCGGGFDLQKQHGKAAAGNGQGGNSSGDGFYCGCGGAGSAGAGFLSNGTNSGAKAFINGGAGDNTERPGQCVDSGLGGFGGGGNGGNGGGGGGGYEGGNGGGINNTNAYGSGGKSFNSGTNPIGEDGIRVGQGELTITLL